ncbi:peptidase S41-like protein [Christiangramia gaetbulicola]|uniref:Peptidase S41-like protein n=2 Tax=Christiangramia gaetbulicola TaxID=703340 RepID=A0A2T6AHL7_9FLAO|nr:peptidase S41-like protein [Christiangramia gaetbulicola]
MFLFLTGGIITSCSDSDDVEDFPVEKPDNTLTAEEELELEIKDFVWKAMNNIYLYKSDVPDLADNRFSSQTELKEYLLKWDSPEDLFYDGLLYDYPEKDRFSWIVDDYVELENMFQATGKSAGFKYGFAYAPNSNSQVLAYVTYVSPGGPADDSGLERGDYISEVNGSTITVNNYQGIFGNDVLELGLSTIQDGVVVPEENPITVTKASFKEETVPVSKVFTEGGVKIGYLYLSTFLGEFGIDDTKLNNVFGEFKAQNVQELIVDLRYNSGGYSEFSADLASMVTGQFEGEIFTQQKWNENYQAYFEQEAPERLYNRFDSKIDDGAAINSLNLNRVYVIATGRSYSASESFIIGLEPYIDVVHVGSDTGGKFQGSVTLYDSENFSKTGANPDHKYALQPLVYKFANANGYTDFIDGLTPDVLIEESPSNLGQLGELDEPLLAETIAQITGNRSQSPGDFERWESGKLQPEDERGFYISSKNIFDELPQKKPLFK